MTGSGVWDFAWSGGTSQEPVEGGWSNGVGKASHITGMGENMTGSGGLGRRMTWGDITGRG